jgi:hypothetical protein
MNEFLNDSLCKPHYIWDYINLSFNTTEITYTLFTNYIDISRIYLRLKKRYLKSLKIVIQQVNNSKLDVYADHIYHIELEKKKKKTKQTKNPHILNCSYLATRGSKTKVYRK